MNRPMMDPAQRRNEFIAHLAAERTRLHEPQMMGIGGFSPAHETGLLRDKPEMFLIATPPRLGDCKDALVYAPGWVAFWHKGFSLLRGDSLECCNCSTLAAP